MSRSIRTAGAAAAIVLTIGSLGLAGPASAEPSASEPCAQQQKQVDRAEDALERVTAVFAAQQEQVAEARGDVRSAEKRNERAQAREELKEAKADQAKAQGVKKAQQQRLAKAEERLAACQAEPTEEPAEEPAAVPVDGSTEG